MDDSNTAGHFQYTDDQFEAQFANLSLRPELFDHEAHLRLAWIHITKYGMEKALQRLSSQLKAYTAHLGAADKYHHTMTIAAVKAVYHFVLRSSSQRFPDFIREFPRLKHNFMELMRSHYSEDIFKSEHARTNYIKPDLVPFD